jgi:hypothetical protein
MGGLRVAICDLLPKLDGFEGLLSAVASTGRYNTLIFRKRWTSHISINICSSLISWREAATRLDMFALLWPPRSILNRHYLFEFWW